MLLDYSDLKNRLWRAADELRANSRLRSHEYSVPILGLIFLRYAGYNSGHAQAKLAAGRSSRRPFPTLPPLITLCDVAGHLPGGAGG
jgi:type I restriction enzyme M protein